MKVNLMRCPNCNSENNEGAKFCKKCGTPLKNNTMSHESVINSVSGKSNDNTTKYIIIALIIVAVVLAGAFIYIYGFGNNDKTSQGTSAPVIKNKSTKKFINGVKVKVKVYTGKKYKSYILKTNKKGLIKLNTKKLKKGKHKVIITSANKNYSINAKSLIKIKR